MLGPISCPLALHRIACSSRSRRAALERPPQTYDESLRLTEYYITRNETARRSHHNTWLQKHKRTRRARTKTLG